MKQCDSVQRSTNSYAIMVIERLEKPRIKPATPGLYASGLLTTQRRPHSYAPRIELPRFRVHMIGYHLSVDNLQLH